MELSQNELQTQIHYRLIEKLSESERRYRELIERLQEIVFKADQSGCLLFLNSSWTTLLGYDVAASLGRPLVEFIAIEFQVSFSNLLEKLKIEKTIAHEEICFQHQDGQILWLELSAYFDSENVYSGLLHNITERKQAEKLIRETNACLMESEKYLKEKSDQLESSLKALKEFQLQIVQSEKMASLGNLVAGVAHEINNPIGFLNGSIKNAKDYIQDILKHIAIYQQYYPNAADPIQDHAEDIDLEYINADLPKLLMSMDSATDRIKNISISLRTFSRADSEYRVKADIHQGIDSTILILKYRIKANEHRPAIDIIQDYDGDIPEIQCFPGQLNQVFMNILANAIDMFDEAAQSSSFTELQANPQRIRIKTALTKEDSILISISDNGKGMTESVQSQVFEHLFTTKPVGQGTGLGLSISYQIITEKHQGNLRCESTPGKGTTFTIEIPV